MKRVVAIMALMIVVGLSSTARAQSLGSLTSDQGALYLACYGVASGTQLPVNQTANVIAAETMLNKRTVSQFKKLTALRGNTFLQLGQLEYQNLQNYGCQIMVQKQPSVQHALQTFTTETAAGCLSIASAYAPLNPLPPTAPNAANITLSSTSNSATLSGEAGAVQAAGVVTVTDFSINLTCTATVASTSSGSFPAVTICSSSGDTIGVRFDCGRFTYLQVP